MTSCNSTNAKSIFIIILAILLYGIIAGIRATTSVFTTEIAAATGLSYGDVSSVFAIRNLVFAVTCPLFGILTRKIPIRYIMAGGALLAAIGLIGAGFSTNYISLVIFIGFLLGIGAGALSYSIVYSAAAPFLGEKYSAICAGVLSASQGAFNIIITPFIQGMGSTEATLTICFVVLGAIVACLVPLCLILHKKPTENTLKRETQSTSIIEPLKFMVKQPFIYLLAFGFLTYGLCDGGMINHLYEKATGVFSASEEFGAFLVIVYGFSIMVGPIIGGFIVSHMKNLRFGIVCIFSIWLAVSTIPIFTSISEIVTCVVVFIMGATISSFIPFICILTKQSISFDYFPTVFSILSVFPVIAYSLDGFFGGICYDLFANFGISILITYIMCIIVILLFLKSGLKYRKNKSEKSQ